MDSKVTLKEKNPHEAANIFSKLLLLWSFKLFYTGHKRDLTTEDLWEARRGDSSESLGDQLEASWQKERTRADASGTRPSLGRAIIRTFWLQYTICGIFVGLLFIVVMPLVPYMLGLFIRYFSDDKTPETYRNAHIHNFVMNALSVSSALLLNHLNLSQGSVGMRVRISCCSLIYRKILKLDRNGLSKTEPGQVINLMSNDVNRFDVVTLYLHYLWVMPVVVPVTCYLVWQQVQWATLAALGVICLQSIVVQAYLSNKQGVLRGKIAKRTDERVRVMTELISGVQVIKMYAWEIPFEKLVANLRKLEVNFIMKTSMIKGFSIALMVFTERFILYAAIVTFVVAGGIIRADITFSLLQYFNLLQLACNIFFPMALSFLAETKVSIRRLEDLLLLEEINESKEETVVSSNINGMENNSKLTGLLLCNANASWSPNPIVHTLQNIDLLLKPGQFLGIAGPVGAGKSSLLQVILGELPLNKGSLSLGGARVSYASQEPWLFVSTVRQNILFGQPYDKVRYKKVVHACALTRDFEQLPHGDLTLVGERGISLSGGQRARIGLARAVYRQADIYLLDDPLSAVDTHVGKHLVTNCILGLLDGTTRLLVTHQLHHLKSADEIIILCNGKIESRGTFDDVSRTPLFCELLEEDEPPAAPKSELKLLRSTSIQSRSSSNTIQDALKANEEEEPQESAELMEKGRVSGSVYLRYFRAGGGWALLGFTLFSILLAQTITSMGDLWVTKWMNEVENSVTYNTDLLKSENMTDFPDTTNELNASEMINSNVTDGDIGKPNMTVMGTMLETFLAIKNITQKEMRIVNDDYYIYIWTIFIIACIILTTGRALLFLWVCMRSSICMHNTMFSNILQATMRFFDTNPSGRILNRFSKDMGVVDEMLPRIYLDSIQITMVMLGILVMVAIVNPYMLLTTACCAVLMYFWTVVYLSTAQAIKRIEGVTRSPVFSHVTASMAGLTTVRACGAQLMLRRQFDCKQDVHTAAWYLTLVTNTAFSVWLSMISACYVIVVAYSFLLTDDGTTKSGSVGLAISQSLILVNMVQYGVKQTTEVIAQMTSVERVLQYTSLPKEQPLKSPPGRMPPPNWPSRARLVFKDLYLQYADGEDPVLKNLNLVIESGWKVGVVGRTGAGKSSLIAALFRLAPLDGAVFIDDIDTGELGLRELRTKISIIPQEPVLFSASLRYNLDPFDKYTDEAIWQALEQVELKSTITSLSASVAIGGSNFSAGQRQLLCLARAALAHNRILVLDEATANVDPNTDALIQKSIRKYFADCTVITVAHRLHTVADSDRVVVMDAGQLVQFGHPHVLLQDKEGTFANMVSQMGAAAEQSLCDVARQAYEKHIRYVDTE